MNSRRVVKVGGSLFDYEQLPAKLTSFLSSLPPAPTILLAGGGDWAEALREADRRFHLGEAAAHRLCIDAMSVTARLLATLIEAPLVSRLEEVSSVNERAVFDAGPHWRREEPSAPGEALPASWRATSDSIAARLAELCGADELILLKSADPPASSSLAELAKLGYVDEFFPFAARTIASVRYLNLRKWS
jgi:aspartokinase-like uncharacterized kinase